MENKDLLMTVFSLEEPNFRTAREKNKRGECCISHCNNKSYTKWRCGLMICKQCFDKNNGLNAFAWNKIV